jgi:hypothetical protein
MINLKLDYSPDNFSCAGGRFQFTGRPTTRAADAIAEFCGAPSGKSSQHNRRREPIVYNTYPGRNPRVRVANFASSRARRDHEHLAGRGER